MINRWQPLLDASRKGGIVLLYGAKEETFNNAVALKDYLEVVGKKSFSKKIGSPTDD